MTFDDSVHVSMSSEKLEPESANVRSVYTHIHAQHRKRVRGLGSVKGDAEAAMASRWRVMVNRDMGGERERGIYKLSSARNSQGCRKYIFARRTKKDTAQGALIAP
jgi:hypothetical protein